MRAALSAATASPISAGKRIVLADDAVAGVRIGSGGAAERDEELRPGRAQPCRDRHRRARIGMHDGADHDGPRVCPFHGRDPVVQRKIRPQVDHREPGPTQRCREDEPAQLVARPRRHPDEHRSALVAARPGCLERGREATKNRVACHMLARDGTRPAAQASPRARSDGITWSSITRS